MDNRLDYVLAWAVTMPDGQMVIDTSFTGPNDACMVVMGYPDKKEMEWNLEHGWKVQQVKICMSP